MSHSGYIMSHRGCIMSCRGCIMSHRDYSMTHRAYIMSHRGYIMSRRMYLDPSGSCYLLHGSSILRKSHVFMISGSRYFLGNIAI